mgnify:CR=1 FL=1
MCIRDRLKDTNAKNDINKKNLNNYILQHPESSWHDYESIICEPIKVNPMKKIKMIKRGWRSVFKNPSLLFKPKKQNILLHFDMFHGYGNLKKAISQLEPDDRSDFYEYVNSRDFLTSNIIQGTGAGVGSGTSIKSIITYSNGHIQEFVMSSTTFVDEETKVGTGFYAGNIIEILYYETKYKYTVTLTDLENGANNNPLKTTNDGISASFSIRFLPSDSNPSTFLAPSETTLSGIYSRANGKIPKIYPNLNNKVKVYNSINGNRDPTNLTYYEDSMRLTTSGSGIGAVCSELIFSNGYTRAIRLTGGRGYKADNSETVTISVLGQQFGTITNTTDFLQEDYVVGGYAFNSVTETYDFALVFFGHFGDILNKSNGGWGTDGKITFAPIPNYHNFNTPQLEPGEGGIFSLEIQNRYIGNITDASIYAEIYHRADIDDSETLVEINSANRPTITENCWNYKNNEENCSDSPSLESAEFNIEQLLVNQTVQLRFDVNTKEDTKEGTYFVRFSMSYEFNETDRKLQSRGFWNMDQWTNATTNLTEDYPGNINLDSLNVDGIIPDSSFGVKKPIPKWPLYLLICLLYTSDAADE